MSVRFLGLDVHAFRRGLRRIVVEAAWCHRLRRRIEPAATP
ncbi:MAG: hypothetical protein ACRD01_06935 [Terriglobales bacterium]